MPEKYRGPFFSQHGLDAGGGERRQQKVFPWENRSVESPSGTGKGSWRDMSEKSVGRLVALAISEFSSQPDKPSEDPIDAVQAFKLQPALQAYPRILDKVLDNPTPYSYEGKVLATDTTVQSYKEILDTVFSQDEMYAFLLTMRKIRKERDVVRSENSHASFARDIKSEALVRLERTGDTRLLQNFDTLAQIFFDEVEEVAYRPDIIRNFATIHAAESALQALLIDSVISFSWDTYAIDPSQTIQRFIGYMRGAVKQLRGNKHSDYTSDAKFSQMVNKDTGIGIADRLADPTDIERDTLAKAGLDELLSRMRDATVDLPPIAMEIFVQHAVSDVSIAELAQQYALNPEDVTDYIAMVRGKVLSANVHEPLPSPMPYRAPVEGLPKLASAHNPVLSFISNEQERQGLLHDFSDRTLQERRIYEIALAAANGTTEACLNAVAEHFPRLNRSYILVAIYESLRKDGFPYRYFAGNKTVWTAMGEMKETLKARLEASGEKKRDHSENLRKAITVAMSVPEGGDVKAAIIAEFQKSNPQRGSEAIDTALKDAMRAFFPDAFRSEWEVTAHKVLYRKPDMVRDRLQETGVMHTAAGELVNTLLDLNVATGDRMTTIAHAASRLGIAESDYVAFERRVDKAISEVTRNIFSSDEEWEALGLGTRNMYRRFKVYGEEMLRRIDEVSPEFKWTLSPREKQVLTIALREGVSTRKAAIAAVQAAIPELNEQTIDMHLRRGVKRLISHDEWEEMTKNNVFLGGWLQQRKLALGPEIHARERVIARYGDILKAALEATGSNPERIIDQVFSQFPQHSRKSISRIITYGIRHIANEEQKRKISELHTSPVWNKLLTGGQEVLELLDSERGYHLRNVHAQILRKAVQAAQELHTDDKQRIVARVEELLHADPATEYMQFAPKSIDRAIRYGCNLLYGNEQYNGVKNLRNLIRYRERQQMKKISGYPNIPDAFWHSLPTFAMKNNLWKAVIEGFYFSDNISMTYQEVAEYVYANTGISITANGITRVIGAIRQRMLDPYAAASLGVYLAGSNR